MDIYNNTLVLDLSRLKGGYQNLKKKYLEF